MFAIQQKADGGTDRRAIGGELHYFDSKNAVFSLVDYDILFDKLNILSVQGSSTFTNGASVNFLYDYRRSPTLLMTNALQGQPQTTLAQLQLTMTDSEIMAQAIGLTPISRVALLGGTYPVSKKWQLAADFRISSVSGTIATPYLAASPASGQVKSFSAQAIGTGIVLPSGVLIFNSAYLTSPSYNAWLVGVSSRFQAWNHWTFEPGIKYYNQDAALGTTTKRWLPSGRLTYQLGNHMALEAEMNVEMTRTVASASNASTTSLFYYVGYRYDF
jgi:hypothetical protein